jgi:hypothetical protein
MTNQSGGLNPYGTSDKNRLLGRIKQHRCFTTPGSYKQVPYFVEKNSSKAMDREIFDKLNFLNEVPLGYVDRKPNSFVLADGSVSFKTINTSNYQFEVT